MTPAKQTPVMVHMKDIRDMSYIRRDFGDLLEPSPDPGTERLDRIERKLDMIMSHLGGYVLKDGIWVSMAGMADKDSCI